MGSPPSTPTQSSLVGGVAQGVTDGATCAPQGAQGVTKDGVREVFDLTGGVTRWKPA